MLAFILVSLVELDTAADRVVRGQLERLRFIQILTPVSRVGGGGSKLLFSSRLWANG